MRFETLEEAGIAAANAVCLTDREKVIVLAEFGTLLSNDTWGKFVIYLTDGSIFFGYTEGYLQIRRVNAKIGAYERLRKIDQKLGLFRNDDMLRCAIVYFAYDVLENSDLVQVTLFV